MEKEKELKLTTLGKSWLLAAGCAVAVALLLAAAPAGAQGVCTPEFCEDPQDTLCDAGGFRITLVDYQPASNANSGLASYTYEICSPPEGVCTGDGVTSCEDNTKCTQGGNPPGGTCTRECAVDVFRDLSHFDVGLPALVGTCLTEDTEITGSCTPGPFSIGPDGSCGGVFVAKCDAILEVGDCYEMTINIAGELNSPGLGSAFVVSKESTDCNETCLLGPACDDDICDPDPPTGEECLTRTRGFWGTHPHLIQSDDPRSLDLLPVTVCGDDLPVVDAGVYSTSEALCTSARDRRRNPTYLSMAAQLTAAKLNLAATAAVSDGACSAWMYDGMGIEGWIEYCEDTYCDARKQAISESGCIEALDDFNNSQDTGFDQTPAPFDRPGPALVDECQSARGNGIYVGGGC